MSESGSIRDIAKIVAQLRDTTDGWSTRFGQPVTCEMLAEVEDELCIALPEELRELYRIANGIDCEVTTKYNAYTSFVAVFPIDRMTLYTKSLDEYTNQAERIEPYAGVPHRFIAFADLLDGDLCCLDLDRPAHGKLYTVIATDHEQPRSWPKNAAIATSISDWLERVLAAARDREFLNYWERQDTRTWPDDADRPSTAIR